MGSISPRTARKIANGMAATVKEGCAICGDRPQVSGFWTPGPDARRRLMVPTGKYLAVAFSLCGKCVNEPGSIGVIEAALFARAEQVAASPDRN